MNIVIYLVPFISLIFGLTYYYSSREFTELLLVQPLKRKTIVLGQFLGVSICLSLSLVFGLSIPFFLVGAYNIENIFDLFVLILLGCFLTFIFTSISYIISIMNDNKIRGLGYSILVWLFLSVIYDGFLMSLLIYFEQYPLEKISLVFVLLNPIDLARTLMILNLDISALLGYTGALYKIYFGTFNGIIVSSIILFIWLLAPVILMLRIFKKKDF